MAKKDNLIEKEEVVIIGNEKEKQTDIAKCPSCGGNMIFDAEKQLLKCEHCGTEKPFALDKTAEQAFEKLFQKTNEWADETHVFSCSNCGAKEILSKSEISKECSFCGTSNVVESKELAGLKPNAVVPFRINLETAIDKVIAWAKKRFFAPKRFKRGLTAEDVKGTYNPAFTFDSDTLSMYKGRLGKYRYITTKVNGKTVTKRVTDYFRISGSYSAFYDDVLIQASTAIKQKVVDKLQPFGTNEAKDYKQEFLHGYSASQYTKDGTACWTEAKRVIDKRIRSGILSKYTYDVVDYLEIKTEHRNITYKYLLLPIYVGHFNYSKKLYNFFVSGHNGKVAGKTPVSIWKVGLVTLLGLVAAAGIGLLVYFLG